MYCSECGSELPSGAKFCPNCGQATLHVTRDSSISPAPKKSPQSTVDSAVLGTKWLAFWNYVSLPVGGLLGIVFAISTPELGAIVGLVAAVQLTVAYGLHKRMLWAWQWNWVLIVLCGISPAAQNALVISEDFWPRFAVSIVVTGLVWFWPNYVYWRKRQFLFSRRAKVQSDVWS